MAIKKTADEIKYGLKAGASQRSIDAAKVREANRNTSTASTNAPSTVNFRGQTLTATPMGNQTFDPSKAARTGATLVGRTQTVPPVSTPAMPATNLNTYTSGGRTYTAPAGTAADKLYSSKYTPTPTGITRTEDLEMKSPTIREIGGTPKFQVDPEKEKLAIRAEWGDPSLTEDEKALAKEYVLDQIVYNRTRDPNAGADRVQKSYDRIQEEYQRQIKEAERQKQIEAERMAAERGGKIEQFVANQNVIYEPEVQQAQKQGEIQKESVRQILSFSGFGRSTKTVEKLTEVDQNVDQRIRAIEAIKQAEAMRYQAQLEDADAMTLASMDKAIRDLRDKSNQLNLDSMVKIEELKLEAQQKGDEMAMEQLKNLQATFMEDLNAYDEELSRNAGFLMGADGKPILDNSGQIQALPKNYDFGSPITAANGDVSIPVFDEASGTFKMVPTGVRERVPGSGGGSGIKDGKWENVIDDASGKEIQQRKLADGTMEYRYKSSGKPLTAGGKPYVPARTSKITTYKGAGEDPLQDIAETLQKAING